jgi:hypothetical protein
MDCKTLRFPRLLGNRFEDGSEVVSLIHRPPLVPGRFLILECINHAIVIYTFCVSLDRNSRVLKCFYISIFNIPTTSPLPLPAPNIRNSHMKHLNLHTATIVIASWEIITLTPPPVTLKNLILSARHFPPKSSRQPHEELQCWYFTHTNRKCHRHPPRFLQVVTPATHNTRITVLLSQYTSVFLTSSSTPVCKWIKLLHVWNILLYLH